MTAHTSSGIERNIFSAKRISERGSAPNLPLAGSANAKPKTKAMPVPNADMESVSSVACATFSRKGKASSGGAKPRKNSRLERAASLLKSSLHLIFSE
jgi:hypothetical protein